ncbi:tRNA epoxyqueuosine(34) reductase QueG [Dysgonomonas sp. Marseille-P4677]|uniref:tRNA epoxyqueuosine(34) reductase QueG n=1 Tax=Dysgonomonas sp. Marseille-P4677 TaxID=2364790 RepID=UPI0019143F0C|nr:tRNA epoxyqueuosine(34) reductase QueG [Dysgonomonas sp. Marseille-P4677]MBK5720276.1 tRNA epoxyqueuosine(34) reductase QueG [Dysgonomonas sp. Marseille-P4677]
MVTSIQIKEYAYSLGFDACGVCEAEEVDLENQRGYKDWISSSFHANMEYMNRNAEKRLNPTVLVEGARSIICVALNYYPEVKQPEDHPQFAYYAYGKDYHDVVKAKLQMLYDYIKSLNPELEGRCFVDTAPVLERYWAAKAGIGFIGKNSLLIIPKKGSYFFLGELILNLELDYDIPLSNSCGNCTRCIDACPTSAIVTPKVINAKKCISYQTIENKGEIDEDIIPNLNNRFYGCDICQQVCPYNRYARSLSAEEFKPSDAFLGLSFDRLNSLSVEEYQSIFKGSAVKRAKYTGLKRNLEALRANRK